MNLLRLEHEGWVECVVKNILVIEDDEMTNKVISNFLAEQNFTVFSALDGQIGWDIFQKEVVDLIILDIMLPKIDGLTLLAQFREVSQIPIIMLTALDDEYTQVVSYSNLIDDFVTKPFSPTILVKRVEAVLRRNSQEEINNEQIKYGELTIDLDAFKVENQAEVISLTKKEYQILVKLITSKGKIVTREQLMGHIWGYDYNPSDRIIDTHIKNIRKKLPNIEIRTVKGTGYGIESIL